MFYNPSCTMAEVAKQMSNAAGLAIAAAGKVASPKGPLFAERAFSGPGQKMSGTVIRVTDGVLTWGNEIFCPVSFRHRVFLFRRIL